MDGERVCVCERERERRERKEDRDELVSVEGSNKEVVVEDQG